jgi:hypothetical protein
MGSKYLTDLATVCRNAGLVVQEEPNWQTRSRGSGGYDSGRPTHVMIHHTASNPSSDGQSDVNYCCYNSADRPWPTCTLSRSGKVWIMAAGATNTNGKGQDTWGGGVPNDSMNTYAVGIEAANTGTGEPWAQVQQDAYVARTKALCLAYGIPNNNIRQHSEWAPDRKIDPAGPSQWATRWTWNGAAYRQTCAGSTPPPTGGIATAVIVEDKMFYFIKPDNEDATTSTIWVSDMVSKWAARDNTVLKTYQDNQFLRLLSARMDQSVAHGFAYDVLIVGKSAFIGYGLNIDPNMPGRDAWGGNPDGRG